MIFKTLLFDLAPLGGGIGIFLVVAFFFICLAIAFIAFKMLKRTFKLGIRIAIVGIILVVALVGSVAFFILGGGGRGPRPPRNYPTPRATR